MGLKEKIEEYKRILLIAKKPTSFEFKTILKITGIGVIIIGIIGFIIRIIAATVK
ncbi:TPA: protein translocase SEC61 complex subunit gamma [archaeon]|uniref:Protein translocase subunit SecE n=1 Tax=Candidatus Naiadarchaeum limnaeum TaxID=2756139 RepID=A0A832XJ02_9ARCH|nr:protein translocase SEC61 complex subunit gamma [Candidatus Naiadarchaeales archaeon SRR2090153.bin1042]HIJ99931.1 protein translocase SEC61 complex subunit gamma [Candidatus Naiadarchaeum limnaeum]